MSWVESLSYPFMQHAIVGVLFAGIAFPLIGVFVISLNLIPLRFAMMHVALLGGAVGLFINVDPMLMGLLFCALSALALGPLSEKTKIGLGTISGYFMTVTLALAFILFHKGNINVIQALAPGGLLQGRGLCQRTGVLREIALRDHEVAVEGGNPDAQLG